MPLFCRLKNKGGARTQVPKRLSNVCRSIGIVWQASPKYTAFNLILSLVQGVMPLLSLYLVKLIFDAVALGLAPNKDSVVFMPILLLVAAAGAAALLSLLCRQAGEVVGEVLSQKAADKIQGMIHAKSVEVDLEFYENAGYYDNLHRAQTEAPFRPVSIVGHLIQVFQNCISLAGVAVLLFSFNWIITLALFGAAVPAFLVRLKFSGILYDSHSAWTPLERRLWYYDRLITGSNSAGEMRLFNLGGLFIQRCSELRSRIRGEKITMAVRRSGMELSVQASALTAIYISLGFIIIQTLRGAMTIGLLAMYYQAFQRVQGFLGQLLSGLAGIYEDNLFVSNFFELMQVNSRIKRPDKPHRTPRLKRQGIAFENVSFAYPGASRRALHSINLIIRPGEHVAFAGENGSGKTTLLKLLCRLYDPDEGRITADGTDLKDFSPEEWRGKISGIFQDFVRYHVSAGENIWFGDIDSKPCARKIKEVADMTGIGPVIEKFEKGYNTILGKWLEAGEELSSGEWQKLALARAFLQVAPLIILDEPDSALDGGAAREIFDNFRELAGGRTVVISSHRLSAARRADKIFVLKNGALQETGNHRTLMGQRGLYAGMFEKQQAPFIS